MMIRKECLGMGYSKKSPHNSCHFSGVITDNPDEFALYLALKLDVFEKDLPPIAEILSEVSEVEEPVIIEVLKSKKKKKNDSNEINE